MKLNRRSLMLAGGGAFLAQAAPSDRIVVGVIGSGSRGTFVMTVFQKDPAVGVGAICDVYEPNLERALSTASKGGSHPKAYRNYKQLLADKDVQAVLIATPEHWHHQMVLDALAAGKDVYVEKPLCQTPEQGPARKQSPDPDRFRHWRLYSDYSGGLVADQGAHVYDGIHLLMNAGYPLAVNASAGKPHNPGVDTAE